MPAELELYDHDAERALIGAALIDNSIFISIGLDPNDFHLRDMRALWIAGRELVQSGKPVDWITLPQDVVDGAGGPTQIQELTYLCTSPLHAHDYAAIIRDKAEQRRMLRAANFLARAAHADGDRRRELAAKARRRLREIEIGEHVPELELLTADDILTTVWPEPTWAIPGMLPAGLAILAGRPKVGKSWLALQVCQAVATGGITLNEHVAQGPTLYLALEDPPRRLKERMLRQHWPVGSKAEFMSLGNFADQIGDLCNGGSERLAAQIRRREYRMVVIDTLSRSIVGDQNDVEQMTRALTPLQELAHQLNCVVMLIDHHRKGFGDADAIGDIMGSTAKGAMADCVWGLYRERGKANAKLSIIGRDIAERSLASRMDWDTGSWQMEGDADTLEITRRRQEILDALARLGPSQAKAVANAINQDKSNTHRRLQDLAAAGIIRRYTSDDGSVLYARL